MSKEIAISGFAIKSLIIISLFAIALPFANINAQGIGELAPPKPRRSFSYQTRGEWILCLAMQVLDLVLFIEEK